MYAWMHALHTYVRMKRGELWSVVGMIYILSVVCVNVVLFSILCFVYLRPRADRSLGENVN